MFYYVILFIQYEQELCLHSALIELLEMSTPYKKGKAKLEKAREQKSLGNLNKAQKSFKSAVKALEESLSENPVSINIKADLAQACLELGDVLKDDSVDEARKYYNRAEQLGHSQAADRLNTLPLTLVPKNLGSALKTMSTVAYSIIIDHDMHKFFQDPPPLPEVYPPFQDYTLLIDTRHLTYCLQQGNLPDQQKSQLKTLASWVVEGFVKEKDDLKDSSIVNEVVVLGIVLEKEDFGRLMNNILHSLKKAILLQNQADLLTGLTLCFMIHCTNI